MTDTEIASIVHKELGSPPDTELASSDIKDRVADGIVEINKWVPKPYLKLLEDISGQEHTFTENIISIFEVYWTDISLSISYDNELYWLDTEMFNWSYASYMVWLRRKNIVNKLDVNDWYYDIDSKKITFLKDLDDAFIFGGEGWTISVFPDRYKQLLIWWLKSTFLELLAEKRRKLSGITRPGGLITYSSSDSLNKQAKEVRELFEKSCLIESKKVFGLL